MNKMTDHELAQIVWDYMRYEQPLEKADIIIGLGSDDIRIAEYAADLYMRGYGSKLLFTGGLIEGVYQYFLEPEAIAFQNRAIELGVPRDAIMVEDQAQNTGENITKSYRILSESGSLPEKIILVQKPFMLRRTYATFMKQWPAKDKPKIITTAIALTMDEYVQDPRYRFERMLNVMIGDLQRIREYPKLGFQIEQDIPENVCQAYEELVSRGYTERLME